MNPLKQIARSALSGDALATRSLVQDWLATLPVVGDVPAPLCTDATLRALTAALTEMFAARLHQPAPAWTANIGASVVPIYLVRSATHMRRLREMCEAESPLPLRRRHIYAPANYLQAV